MTPLAQNNICDRSSKNIAVTKSHRTRVTLGGHARDPAMRAKMDRVNAIKEELASIGGNVLPIL
jgi:hypothetical protein